MEDEKTYTYDVKPLTEEEAEHIKKYLPKDKKKYMRVGPAGYVLPTTFLNYANEIRHLPLRSDDVFVVSYPRSGTTWTQELVWLVINDLDFDKAKSIPLQTRYQFLESYMFFPPEMLNGVKDKTTENLWKESSRPSTEVLSAMKSQRFIKTHLPPSLLPTATLDTTKVVYVARDVRDAAVSVYYFGKSNKLSGVVCDFKEFYKNIFAKDLFTLSPYFDHIKEAWALRDHPNMLNLFYEDMSKDLKTSAKRVAGFFGKQYTDEQLDQLCSHLAFDNFRKNKAVDFNLKQMGLFEDETNSFFRKGKAGGWRDYFDEEMAQHAKSWMDEELQGTGLQFPQ